MAQDTLPVLSFSATTAVSPPLGVSRGAGSELTLTTLDSLGAAPRLTDDARPRRLSGPRRLSDPTRTASKLCRSSSSPKRGRLLRLGIAFAAGIGGAALELAPGAFSLEAGLRTRTPEPETITDGTPFAS